MDRLENLLSRTRDPRAFADLLLGVPREAAGVARQFGAVLSSSFADGSASMEITFKACMILLQLALAGFIVWGAYLCLSTYIRDLRAARMSSPRSAPAATPRQPSFERVASLVLLALLCTTLAGVA
jgi:hypothetical protein